MVPLTWHLILKLTMPQPTHRNELKEELDRLGIKPIDTPEYLNYLAFLKKLLPKHPIFSKNDKEYILDRNKNRLVDSPIISEMYDSQFDTYAKGPSFSLWLDSFFGPKVASVILDGETILLEYNGGNLVNAYFGAKKKFNYIVLDKVLRLKNIPKSVSNKSLHWVGVSINIETDVLVKKYGKFFKTPFFFIRQIFRTKGLDSCLEDLTPIAYSVFNLPFKGKLDEYAYLNKNKFNVVEYIKDAENYNAEYFKKYLADTKTKSKFLVKGLLIELNNYDRRDQLGLNRLDKVKHAVILKDNPEECSKDTEIIEINWKIGLFGRYIPHVKCKPVLLGNKTTKLIHVDSYAFIKSNKIGVGSRVRVAKVGFASTSILEVLKESTRIKAPKVCKYCNTKIKREKHSGHIYCPNKECIGSKAANITYFFHALNIKHISTFRIYNILKEGRFNCLTDFIKVKSSKKFLGKAIGEPTAKRLYEQLKTKLKNVELAKLMVATGFFEGFVSYKNLEKLINLFGDITEIPLTKEQLIKTNLLYKPSINVTKILEGIKQFNIWFADVKDYITYTTDTTTKDMPIYVFSNFTDRHLKARLITHKCLLSNVVTKNVTAVIVKDLEQETEETKLAKELNVTILTKKNTRG